MTWFRCGGGSGMPADLKNRMNAVFNKKFGTAVDYPAEGWPDDVNLMGPLPEKTIVFSPIADFSDGADDVPTKSLIVTIPPTLSGVSSVTEKQTGKNLCPNSFEQGTFSEGAPVGSDYATMKFANTIRGRSTDIFRIDNGNVNVSCADGYQLFITLFGSDGKYLGQYAGWTTDTAITNSSAYYIAVAFKRNDNETITNADFEAVHVMCEVGSSTSTYEPYAPTQYTATLGRTIHGGKVDIVNGTGTDENGNDFTFDGQEIPTRLGYNAFWSDQGDTEVTYRADISLALQAVSNNRGLMMTRPAIEPANGDQGSEESTENNIETEGEEDAR